MKKHILALLTGSALASIVVYQGCTGFTASPSSATNYTYGTPTPTPTYAGGSNVMAVTVGCSYADEPCVSVTVCAPGSNNCTTVPNVLLDTGSSGLRLFSSTISGLGLSPASSGSGGSLAECQTYVDGTSDWGAVTKVDIIMGSERASNVLMQAIDANFAGIPSGCTNPDQNPSSSGYNGILGVGLFVGDCGSTCASSSQNQIYYSCSGSTCTNIAVQESGQVSNPVAFMATDNNGVILSLPQVSTSGSGEVSGQLILGIGTESNNQPSGVRVLTADNYGNFGTTWQGQSYSSSFIDSGSNGLYFPQPNGMTICPSSSSASGWFCPTNVTTLSATQVGLNGVSVNVSFEIGNAQTLLDGGGSVFNDIGAPNTGGFDWGLPFFFGRSVFVGFEGKSSSVASGMYWAF